MSMGSPFKVTVAGDSKTPINFPKSRYVNE